MTSPIGDEDYDDRMEAILSESGDPREGDEVDGPDRPVNPTHGK